MSCDKPFIGNWSSHSHFLTYSPNNSKILFRKFKNNNEKKIHQMLKSRRILLFGGCFALILSLICSLLPFVQADANSKLKKCCAKLVDDDKDCVTRFCDFDAISQANVLNYLSTCTDRGETVGHMWDCASSRIDHTECCSQRGVSGKCLEYCSAHDGVPTNYLDYLFCIESFNEIRDCFKEHMEAN